jgi:hypothetical protein
MLGLLVAFTACLPECKKAQPEDVPHGANMLIEFKQQKVTHVSGTVLQPNGEPAGDIVIEVYHHSGKLESSATVQPPRLKACVTGDDGKFSFPELKSGQYVLRIGTRESIGVQKMLVPLIVKRLAWPGKHSKLKLKLALGT